MKLDGLSIGKVNTHAEEYLAVVQFHLGGYISPGTSEILQLSQVECWQTQGT